MFNKIRLFLLPFLLFSFYTKGQEPNITTYDLSSVFPSSAVYALHQDNKGNIWIANGIGVCRYDGYEFTSFDQQDGIPGSNILKLFPQENGEIWGYCLNHNLFHFNENFNGFHSFPYNDSLKSYLTQGTEIKSLVVDNNGTVHIGGQSIPPSFQIDRNGNVDFYDTDETVTKYLCLIKNHFYTSPVLTPLVEKSIFVKLDTRISSPHIGGIQLNDSTAVFMTENTVFIKKGNTQKQIKTGNTSIMLKKVNDSSFAVGYYHGGIRFFDENGNLLGHFIKDKSVSDLLIDHSGSYWISTLFNDLQYIENIEVKSMLNNEFISDLEKDPNGNLFVGCRSSKIYKREQGQLEPFYLPNETRSPALFIYVIKNDSFQIVSNSHLLNNQGQPMVEVKARGKIPEYITELPDSMPNHKWPFNLNLNEDDRRVMGIVREVAQHENDFYISTFENELFKYDAEQDTIIRLSAYSSSFSARIEDINIPYGRNSIYLCTQGEGLVIVQNEAVTHINEKKGLSSDYVNKVYIENDSTVWVGTSTGPGVIMFQPNGKYYIHSLNQTLGLASNDVTDLIVVDDTVWVGTQSGLYFFPKKVLLEKQEPELFFRLQHVFQDKDTVHNNVELNSDQNSLSFYLNAVSFDRNEDILYHYRIKEINENWRTTKNREIVFQDLNPGAYTFEAKVEVRGYFPNDLVEFNFTIHPPFWKTWWFYSLYVLAGGFMIYLFFKIRVLTYNKDVVRELMRHLLKRIKKEEHSFVVRANGEDIKILSETVLYVKSAGNYLELYTTEEKHLIRGKISTFIEETTDPLEYLRVHRSYVIRIDKVDKKGKNWVVINGEKIPVGESYLDKLKGIQF